MNFGQVLEFNSQEELPQELKCLICLDICRTPSVRQRNFKCKNSCSYFYSTNGNGDYLLSLIQIKCQLCERYIKYFRFNQHFEKCHSIFLQTPKLINCFDPIPNENYLNCFKCNQICFLPILQLNEIICKSCGNDCEQNNEFQPISFQIMKSYGSHKVKCKKCSKIISLFKSFRHYKKCRELTTNLIIKSKNYKFHIFKLRCRHYHTSVQESMKYNFESQKLVCEQKYYNYQKLNIDKKIRKINDLLNQQILK